MSGGITIDGFTIKTLEELQADIEAEQRATIDPAISQAPTQPLGQLNGIWSRKFAELWEVAQTCYNAFNPAAAEGVQADNVAALTGTVREPAIKSRAVVTLNLNAAVTVPAGSVVAVDGQPQFQFELVTEVTSTSSGDYDGIFDCTQTGPVPANAGTLTDIVTPVSGWNSATNAEDAILGAVVESDSSLLLRRQDELAAPGDSTLPGIKADVLLVTGVLDVLVFENTTLVVDANNLPGKSFEVVVWDSDPAAADDTEVATTIWDSKPAGIETYGSTTTAITDSDDIVRNVKWSRATTLDVWLEYDLVTNAHYPVDGDAQLKALVVAFCQTAFGLDDDVVALVLRAKALEISGVVDVTALRLGFSASPSGTSNLTVGIREIAQFDSTRIEVNS